MYRHYSFDLWNTLMKSHPEYKRKRAQYFYDHMNVKKSSTVEEIEAIVRDVDIMCNNHNEMLGLNLSVQSMYAFILYKMGWEPHEVSVDDVNTIHNAMRRILMEFPPVIYGEDTLGVLKELKDSGRTISITSNTAFILGVDLRVCMPTDLSELIDFHVYSDEERVSKPAGGIFTTMTIRMQEYYVGNRPSYQEIIHIGDSQHADIHGANSFGIKGFRINSNDKSIKDIPR
jgi:putative hydrolase of the HAD superfamily